MEFLKYQKVPSSFQERHRQEGYRLRQGLTASGLTRSRHRSSPQPRSDWSPILTGELTSAAGRVIKTVCIHRCIYFQGATTSP